MITEDKCIFCQESLTVYSEYTGKVLKCSKQNNHNGSRIEIYYHSKKLGGSINLIHISLNSIEISISEKETTIGFLKLDTYPYFDRYSFEPNYFTHLELTYLENKLNTLQNFQ